MAASAALSDEDFNRLQNQLIELRTLNYDLGSKLKKAETDNVNLQEKCNSQEKEIQKLSKIMKFPGFQAITKSKSKKDLAELLEENERLNQQIHRCEDDFKLQNQTLLQEVSRLSSENDDLRKSLSSMTNTGADNEDCRRLQVEKAVLQENIQELKRKIESTDTSTTTNTNVEDIQKAVDNLYTDVESKLKEYLLQCKQHRKWTDVTDTPISDDTDTPAVDGTDTPISDDSDTPAVDDMRQQDSPDDSLYSDLKKIFDKHAEEAKVFLSEHFTQNVATNSSDCDINIESALKETRCLEEKLNSLKEASKLEVQQLREEVGKWSDKAKKKQESFLKLQDEKELMYKENAQQLDSLKDESRRREEDLLQKIKHLEETIAAMKSDNKVDDLLGKVEILRSENQALQSELIALKERHRIDQSERIKELLNELNEMKSQNSQNISKIQELSMQQEENEKKITELNLEFDTSNVQFKQANELAEKRKKLLDQTMVDRQHDVEASQRKLEELKQSYEEDMKSVTAKNKEELEDLKAQIVNHKKVKKDLEEARQKLSTLEEEFESEQKKSGWLERSLKETEETLGNVKIENENRLKETETLFEEKVKAVHVKLGQSEEAKQDQMLLVEKLKQASKDKEVELRVSSKKNESLVKDLKRQLNSERKRADQLQLKLQDFIQEIKVKHTYDEIFNPESLQLKVAVGHKRQDSGSHISVVSSASGAENDDSPRVIKTMKAISPVHSNTNLSGLSDETMDLISRIADLQQEKWSLEERVRHLEENGAGMADDLVQKTLVIQSYIMDSKTGTDNSTQRGRPLTLKEKMMDKLKLTDELNREMNTKMQHMLEETLAKNVQLQQDVDLLSKELQTLKTKT